MKRIYLDTNIFISALEGIGDRPDAIRDLLSRLRTLPDVAATSESTVAEFGAGDRSTRRVASTLKQLGTFIEFIPVSYEVLLASCDLRIDMRTAGRSLQLPDAIHCVTALRSNCNVVFTADARMAVPTGLRRVAPDTEGLAMLHLLLDA